MAQTDLPMAATVLDPLLELTLSLLVAAALTVVDGLAQRVGAITRLAMAHLWIKASTASDPQSLTVPLTLFMA
jgi:hypothetical protein